MQLVCADRPSRFTFPHPDILLYSMAHVVPLSIKLPLLIFSLPQFLPQALKLLPESFWVTYICCIVCRHFLPTWHPELLTWIKFTSINILHRDPNHVMFIVEAERSTTGPSAITKTVISHLDPVVCQTRVLAGKRKQMKDGKLVHLVGGRHLGKAGGSNCSCWPPNPVCHLQMPTGTSPQGCALLYLYCLHCAAVFVTQYSRRFLFSTALYTNLWHPEFSKHL